MAKPKPNRNMMSFAKSLSSTRTELPTWLLNAEEPASLSAPANPASLNGPPPKKHTRVPYAAPKPAPGARLAAGKSPQTTVIHLNGKSPNKPHHHLKTYNTPGGKITTYNANGYAHHHLYAKNRPGGMHPGTYKNCMAARMYQNNNNHSPPSAQPGYPAVKNCGSGGGVPNRHAANSSPLPTTSTGHAHNQHQQKRRIPVTPTPKPPQPPQKTKKRRRSPSPRVSKPARPKKRKSALTGAVGLKTPARAGGPLAMNPRLIGSIAEAPGKQLAGTTSRKPQRGSHGGVGSSEAGKTPVAAVYPSVGGKAPAKTPTTAIKAPGKAPAKTPIKAPLLQTSARGKPFEPPPPDAFRKKYLYTDPYDSRYHFPIQMDRRIMSWATKLIKKLERNPYFYIFAKPVDVKALNIPNYPKVIKEPMDFGTITNKLNEEKYGSLDEFFYDVGLVFSNAWLFNKKGNIHEIASQLFKEYVEWKLAFWDELQKAKNRQRKRFQPELERSKMTIRLGRRPTLHVKEVLVPWSLRNQQANSHPNIVEFRVVKQLNECTIRLRRRYRTSTVDESSNAGAPTPAVLDTPAFSSPPSPDVSSGAESDFSPSPDKSPVVSSDNELVLVSPVRKPPPVRRSPHPGPTVIQKPKKAPPSKKPTRPHDVKAMSVDQPSRPKSTAIRTAPAGAADSAKRRKKRGRVEQKAPQNRRKKAKSQDPPSTPVQTVKVQKKPKKGHSKKAHTPTPTQHRSDSWDGPGSSTNDDRFGIILPPTKPTKKPQVVVSRPAATKGVTPTARQQVRAPPATAFAAPPGGSGGSGAGGNGGGRKRKPTTQVMKDAQQLKETTVAGWVHVYISRNQGAIYTHLAQLAQSNNLPIPRATSGGPRAKISALMRHKTCNLWLKKMLQAIRNQLEDVYDAQYKSKARGGSTPSPTVRHDRVGKPMNRTVVKSRPHSLSMQRAYRGMAPGTTTPIRGTAQRAAPNTPSASFFTPTTNRSAPRRAFSILGSSRVGATPERRVGLSTSPAASAARPAPAQTTAARPAPAQTTAPRPPPFGNPTLGGLLGGPTRDPMLSASNPTSFDSPFLPGESYAEPDGFISTDASMDDLLGM